MPPARRTRVRPCKVGARSYAKGQLVSICRARDGRKRSVACVEGYDAPRSVLSLLYLSGEAAQLGLDAKSPWCVTRHRGGPSQQPALSLPPELIDRVAGYLSAKRACLACSISKEWIACVSPGASEDWRRRAHRRWPPPRAALRAARDDAPWRLLYEERLVAERGLKSANRAGRARQQSFTPRLCLWPQCAAVLGTRKAALLHAVSHRGCWQPFNEDARWLRSEQARVLRRHSDFAEKLEASETLTQRRRTHICNILAVTRNLQLAIKALLKGHRRAQPS
ncbi:hypothetical protein M885DRAFT_613881 [Pelagophyceae sp. CCMP2097]|nr:hypothetical protein M885DRAFT_613881 [Pelagophyceae sp. CCMP2097]